MVGSPLANSAAVFQTALGPTSTPGGFSNQSFGAPGLVGGFGAPVPFVDPTFSSMPAASSFFINKLLGAANGTAVNLNIGPIPSTLGFGGLLLGLPFHGSPGAGASFDGAIAGLNGLGGDSLFGSNPFESPDFPFNQGGGQGGGGALAGANPLGGGQGFGNPTLGNNPGLGGIPGIPGQGISTAGNNPLAGGGGLPINNPLFNGLQNPVALGQPNFGSPIFPNTIGPGFNAAGLRQLPGAGTPGLPASLAGLGNSVLRSPLVSPGGNPLASLGGNPLASLGGNPLASLGGNPLASLGGNPLASLGGNPLASLGGNPLASLGGNPLASLGGNPLASLGGNPLASLGGNPLASLGGNPLASLGGNPLASLGGNPLASLGGNPLASLGGNPLASLGGNPLASLGGNPLASLGGNPLASLGGVGGQRPPFRPPFSIPQRPQPQPRKQGFDISKFLLLSAVLNMMDPSEEA